MKNLLLIVFLFCVKIGVGQCPSSLTGNNNNNNPITIYVYNTQGELIDSVTCNLAGNSNNINCDLSNLSDDAYYLSYNEECVYNTDGEPTNLPITLKLLTVKNEGNKNKIYWTTSSEQRNDYFIIEKSDDGINYKEIGQVEGAGNSSQELNYSFTDPNPYLGIGYYRLTQVDFNGQSETFNPVSCEYTVNNTKVFPNPFKNEINIYSTFETYELYSNGRLIKFGEIKQRMDFSDLEVGFYNLVLKTENNIEIIKIVKK